MSSNNIFDGVFVDNLVCALDLKREYELQMGYICDYLKSISPRDYKYYFSPNGFILVDVNYEDIDVYTEFVEGILDCKYTSEKNLNGITIMISLSTLVDSIK